MAVADDDDDVLAAADGGAVVFARLGHNAARLASCGGPGFRDARVGRGQDEFVVMVSGLGASGFMSDWDIESSLSVRGFKVFRAFRAWVWGTTI